MNNFQKKSTDNNQTSVKKDDTKQTDTPSSTANNVPDKFTALLDDVKSSYRGIVSDIVPRGTSGEIIVSMRNFTDPAGLQFGIDRIKTILDKYGVVYRDMVPYYTAELRFKAYDDSTVVNNGEIAKV